MYVPFVTSATCSQSCCTVRLSRFVIFIFWFHNSSRVDTSAIINSSRFRSWLGVTGSLFVGTCSIIKSSAPSIALRRTMFPSSAKYLNCYVYSQIIYHSFLPFIFYTDHCDKPMFEEGSIRKPKLVTILLLFFF